MPSRPGICTSRKTRSGSRSSISFTASRPFDGGGDHLDVGEFLEQIGEFVGRQFFVVHQDRGDGLRRRRDEGSIAGPAPWFVAGLLGAFGDTLVARFTMKC